MNREPVPTGRLYDALMLVGWIIVVAFFWGLYALTQGVTFAKYVLAWCVGAYLLLEFLLRLWEGTAARKGPEPPPQGRDV